LNENIEIDIAYLRPLIIACTAEILTDSIVDKINSSKFNGTFESPITNKNIKGLLPLIEKREDIIHDACSFIKSYEEYCHTIRSNDEIPIFRSGERNIMSN
jgi:hypothetical protein